MEKDIHKFSLQKRWLLLKKVVFSNNLIYYNHQAPTLSKIQILIASTVKQDILIRIRVDWAYIDESKAFTVHMSLRLKGYVLLPVEIPSTQMRWGYTTRINKFEILVESILLHVYNDLVRQFFKLWHFLQWEVGQEKTFWWNIFDTTRKLDFKLKLSLCQLSKAL